jgi:hypothetical protein
LNGSCTAQSDCGCASDTDCGRDYHCGPVGYCVPMWCDQLGGNWCCCYTDKKGLHRTALPPCSVSYEDCTYRCGGPI